MSGEPLHLVIGGRGLIGSALVAELAAGGYRYAWSGREGRRAPVTYDLATDAPERLPAAEIVYLVAAVPSFVACEAQPRETWRVNADAPVALARRYRGSFTVFVSSDAVEFCGGTEYGRQKAYAEAQILPRDDCAVVRPSRIGVTRAAEFANFLVGVGLGRRPGLYRWP